MRRIEDYALIGDTQTAALVSNDGSIDWACFPRFDSDACFAALLGGPEHGRWRIGPAGEILDRRRRYRPGTLVLETELATAGGRCRVIDFMPVRGRAPDIVRIVEGVEGEVELVSDLTIRFGTGAIVPWVRRRGDALVAIAGADALCLRGDLAVHGEGLSTVGRFRLSAGERRAMTLTWFPSSQDLPEPVRPDEALGETEAWWRRWSDAQRYEGPYAAAVATSSMVLKALTYEPTGGIVAAPTTSLPEQPGGVRNWDYRYCWLRDATMTLYALMLAGYRDEAAEWREWLLRATAGDPARLQIMYGVAGERRLDEHEAPWLPGYERSRPVRVGNAAHSQLQLDVYGEVMDAMFQARRFGLAPDRWAWDLETKLLDALESKWRQPDEGIWEIRSERLQFTHSKVMAWVGFDRGLKSIERFGTPGPAEKWRRLRDEIHADVCEHAFDTTRGTFTQSYGRPELDGSLLLMPMVGFLPADDPRVAGTVRAIERELMVDGFLLRYRTNGEHPIDGLPPGEGAFLPCTLWLADAYVAMGRREEAALIFERVLGVANDVGLLSEELEPKSRRLLGNFPQALTHLAVVNTAFNLSSQPTSSARHRKAHGG
ncbi:MAG TPA: glycoside hydrolase family 15 protein [Polyangia bacterium]|nr:glycoside hydrolase family 15 protein [Polyangia bacterium]